MASSKPGQAEAVGFIITKVEDDLKRLAEEVHKVSHVSDPRQAEHLENALERTRSDLKGYAEKLLHESQKDAKELPPISMSTTVPNTRGLRSINELIEHHRSQKKSLSHHKPRLGTHHSILGPSPGEAVKLAYVDKLLSQPHSQTSKQLISDRYGIPLPAMRPPALTTFKEVVHSHPVKPVYGLNIGQLPALPYSKRTDAVMAPPPTLGDDSRKGMLSMLERGLIPTTANIVMNPAPLKPKPAMLHTASQHHIKQDICDGADMKHFPLVHLDLREPEELQNAHTATAQKLNLRMKVDPNPVCGSSTTPPGPDTLARKSPDSAAPTTTSVLTTALAGPPPPGEECYITIHKGVAAEDNAEFIKFKHKNADKWESIASLLHQYKTLAYSYAIPLIVISAEKLSHLSERFEIDLKPTHQDLLECMVNSREVEHLLKTPGRRFKGAGGRNVAAAKIQATFRMFRKVQEYKTYRKRKWAAGVISTAWLLHLKARGVKEQLKAKRAKERINFMRRSNELQRRWTAYKTLPHVVIHVPSLGYAEGLRSQADHFRSQENAQIGRIGSLNNPNVEIIYISPVEVSDELKEYYCKLLLLPNQDTSMEHMKCRLTFITPENYKIFAAKNLHLSAVLLYSPRTIARLKNLIKGKDAYIVPGVMSESDLALADELDVPVLGTDPHSVRLYSTKTAGALKLFSEADVPIPPSSLDVFGEGQVMHRLSQLIANHLTVQRWCFKLNNSIHGQCIAYCDVLAHLPCYQWLLKESERYGAEWSQKWVQEVATSRITEELPVVLEKHTKMVDSFRFPTWTVFLEEMKKTGGVIQACPPPDSVTAITVNLLMEPDGVGTILSTADQVNPRPFWKWGVSVPQTSICLSHLTEEVSKVASALQERGVIGHVSVDFVTFISPDTLEQDLWAVDLDIGMSTCQSMYCLLVQVTEGTFSWDDGAFNILDLNCQPQPRFAVMSTQLFHESLSMIQYSVFLHLCKAHLIGYNTQDNVGCVFTIPDGSDRRHMGMICVETTLAKSLTTMANSLSIIHEEVAVSKDTLTNYKDVSFELNKIAESIEI